jgi:hypothetical protein
VKALNERNASIIRIVLLSKSVIVCSNGVHTVQMRCLILCIPHWPSCAATYWMETVANEIALRHRTGQGLNVFFLVFTICICNQSRPLQFLLSLHVSVLIGPSSGDVHISKL